MLSKTRRWMLLIVMMSCASNARAWEPLPVEDDPLLRMPGVQPAQGVAIESPGRCFNCHQDENNGVTLGHEWKGSMMAQAARDFLFWACMTVSGQDSIWAIGTPNAMDLCERCHFPEGWIEDRSDPPNATLMTGSDFDGLHCDVCHRMYNPFFETTYTGVREGDDWLNYWDETDESDTPSVTMAGTTYQQERGYPLRSSCCRFQV